MVLRVATYNIHKGVRGVGPRKRLEIHNLGLGVEALDADLVFLQEVRLFHARDARRFDRTQFGWPDAGQAEFLAPEGYDVGLPHQLRSRATASTATRCCRAGRSATIGHHDVSRPPLRAARPAARAGALAGPDVHAVVAHFGLIHASRVRQVQRLAEFIEAEVPRGEPLVVAGDFNDWGEQLDAPMTHIGLHARRAHRRAAGPRPPSPRGCRCSRSTASTCAACAACRPWCRAAPAWARMSDHLPLVAELEPA